MISPEGMIGFVREALGFSESVSLKFSPLERRGSDRTFFRLQWNQSHSAILIHYDPKHVENRYYADIALFLHDIEVPAPKLIRHDPADCLILVEDLGNTDLWSLRKAPWATRRALYQKTLSIIHRLHSFPEKDFPLARVRLMDCFNPDLYHWEHTYFRSHFVRDVCGIEMEPLFEEELGRELSGLAGRLSATKRCLVHRDLQSQNVLIHDGDPFLIDFQGMRFGSPFYDLGSLLCDPYVHFSEGEQEELLSFYYERSTWGLAWAAFQNTWREAAAQRLMQALGAYGFLGHKKGFTAFLDHIPAGLYHLFLAASQVSSLPRLQELSQRCQRVMGQKG
jgi:aminoglycoside/choline kinase family phosphotransferase